MRGVWVSERERVCVWVRELSIPMMTVSSHLFIGGKIVWPSSYRWFVEVVEFMERTWSAKFYSTQKFVFSHSPKCLSLSLIFWSSDGAAMEGSEPKQFKNTSRSGCCESLSCCCCSNKMLSDDLRSVRTIDTMWTLLPLDAMTRSFSKSLMKQVEGCCCCCLGCSKSERSV